MQFSKNLIEKSYVRMLIQAKAVSWDLINAEKNIFAGC